MISKARKQGQFGFGRIAAWSLALIVTAPAFAVPAVDFTGQSPIGIAGRTVGFQFTVDEDFVVTSLGLWDRDGDGNEEDRPIGLWDSSGALIACETMPAGSATPLVDSFRYIRVDSPVIVSPGETYTVGAYYTVNSGGIAHQATGLTLATGVNLVSAVASPIDFTFQRPAGVFGGSHPGFFGPNIELTPLAEAELDTAPAIEFGGRAGIGIAGRTVGFEFTVEKGMIVTDLGLWDRDHDGNEEDRPIGLWDSAGTLLATITMPSGFPGELDGDFRYLPLDPPLMLVPGETYTLGAYYTVNAGGIAHQVTDLNTTPGFLLGDAVASPIDFAFQQPMGVFGGSQPGFFGPNVRLAEPTPCFADVDGNGEVDLADLAGLLTAFGSMNGDANYNPAADLDGDDDVDLGDLSGLLAAFGAICG